MSVLRLRIGDHTAVEVPSDSHYISTWRSYTDPPRSWYKNYSSARYDIVEGFDMAANLPVFYFTPIVGSVVYTFTDWGEIIEGTRSFTTRLLFSTKKLPLNVGMYRAIGGPPREHELFALPPFGFGDDHNW